MATKTKAVIRWKPQPMPDPSDRSRTVIIPVIVDRQDPYDLGQLVEQAIDTGRIAGVKPEFSAAIGEALAAQIGVALNSGRGVKFGNFFYVRPYLKGTVENMQASLGPENTLSTTLIPGDGLRIRREDFSFRNVLDTGDSPKIDNIFNVAGSGENDIIGDWAGSIGITGSNLKGAEVKASWKTSGGVDKSVVAVVPYEVDSNPLVQFRLAQTDTPADNTMVTFEVKVSRVVEGVTTYITDSKAVLYKLPITPIPAPTITGVTGEGEDNVNLGGCDVSITGTNLDTTIAVEFAQTADGQAFYSLDEFEYDDNTLTMFADFVGTAPDNGFVRVRTRGGTATHAVSFSNH